MTTLISGQQGQLDRQTYRERDRQTKRQTDKHTDRQTHRQTDRQRRTHRQADRPVAERGVGGEGDVGGELAPEPAASRESYMLLL